MTEPVSVTFLGRFDIIVDGVSALSGLRNSVKSILLLKYLILYRGKPVPDSDLIDTFWAESESSSNPESALKTMISRIRSNLAKISPSLNNCILSESKCYLWNPDIPCVVDAFEFEELCEGLLGADLLNGDTREAFIRALNLYVGDMSYFSADEDWLVSRSMYLHHLYLKMAYRFIELLKQERDYAMVIHVCRVVLDIDTFDETINLELMNALKEAGQSSEALMQYRHITSAYYKCHCQAERGQ